MLKMYVINTCALSWEKINVDVAKVNPKVRVRAPEQEEEECVYQENDSGSWMLSKFIELLYFEVSKSTMVCPQQVTMRSTPSTKGVLKSVKRVGESPKENARGSSVIRPRAVLSSPANIVIKDLKYDFGFSENDGLIGSMNEMKKSRRSDARGKRENESKVLYGEVKKGGKYLEREECEAFNKGKAKNSEKGIEERLVEDKLWSLDKGSCFSSTKVSSS
ncbi:hypothetical protein V8G54_027772 [Vigna mungo]|uniref:Uncharacterized protein n=1 Tax=Vigna mungo TaxID=3915 RepID=A0AAQ3RIR5_VIGMU